MTIIYTALKLNELGRGALDAVQLGYSREQCDEVGRKIREDGAYTPAQWNVGLGCVDCRRQFAGPCLAGGILSGVIAYLSTHTLSEGTNILDVFKRLKALGVPLVLHEDCGTFAAFTDILVALASGKGEVFASAMVLAEKLGADTSLVQTMSKNLARVEAESFMLPEGKLFDSFRELGGVVEEFELEDHTEVKAVINIVAGETLDRNALPYKSGRPRVFTIDLWAVEPLAHAVTGDDMPLAMLAIQLFNCAVLETKAGPDHEVVVRQYDYAS